MKTGFKNRLEETEQKKVKNPWNFDQPPYDQRTSCFVEAGTCYGVGKTQPIGTFNHSNEPVIPRGRVNTLETFYKPKKDSTNIDVSYPK